LVKKLARLNFFIVDLFGENNEGLPRTNTRTLDLSPEMNQLTKSLVMISKWNVAVCYQGPRRFIDDFISGRTILERKDDSALRTLLAIDLISIPFWWDGHRESLLTAIKEQCPTLFEKDGPLERYLKETLASDGISKSYKVTSRNRNDFIRSNTVFRGQSTIR